MADVWACTLCIDHFPWVCNFCTQIYVTTEVSVGWSSSRNSWTSLLRSVEQGLVSAPHFFHYTPTRRNTSHSNIGGGSCRNAWLASLTHWGESHSCGASERVEEDSGTNQNELSIILPDYIFNKIIIMYHASVHARVYACVFAYIHALAVGRFDACRYV